MKQNFIKVSDEDTIEKLIKLGFQLVGHENDYDIFLNTDKLQFSEEIDLKKIKYTNILCV